MKKKRSRTHQPLPVELPTAPPAAPSPVADPASPADAAAPRRRWWQDWRVMVALWLAMAALIALAERFQVNRAVTAGTIVVVGLVSNAFAWLLGIVALVPIVGPLVVKVLSIGFIWLLNAIGYLVSFVAIRRGYTKDVLTYRGVTIALIIGIVIGYVLGKLV
jgi:hypothetical protein